MIKDVGDIYNNIHSQRQFYTVPSTTYPSKQRDFASWLYGTAPTCKQGNKNQCVGNTHERLNQQSYQNVSLM